MNDSLFDLSFASESSVEELDVDEGIQVAAPKYQKVILALSPFPMSSGPVTKACAFITAAPPVGAVLIIQQAVKGFFAKQELFILNRNEEHPNVNLKRKALNGLKLYMASTREKRMKLFMVFRGHCAVLIQKTFRGHISRKKIKIASSVLRVQRMYKEFLSCRAISELRLRRKLSPVVRGYKTRKVLKLEIMQILAKTAKVNPDVKREFLNKFRVLYETTPLPRNKLKMNSHRQPLQKNRSLAKGWQLLEAIRSSNTPIEFLVDKRAPLAHTKQLLAPGSQSKRRNIPKFQSISPNSKHSEIKQKSIKLLELISTTEPVKRVRHKSTSSARVRVVSNDPLNEFVKIESQLKQPKRSDKLLFVPLLRFRLKPETLKKQFDSIEKMEKQVLRDQKALGKTENILKTSIPQLEGKSTSTVDRDLQEINFLKEEYYKLTNGCRQI